MRLAETFPAATLRFALAPRRSAVGARRKSWSKTGMLSVLQKPRAPALPAGLAPSIGAADAARISRRLSRRLPPMEATISTQTEEAASSYRDSISWQALDGAARAEAEAEARRGAMIAEHCLRLEGRLEELGLRMVAIDDDGTAI